MKSKAKIGKLQHFNQYNEFKLFSFVLIKVVGNSGRLREDVLKIRTNPDKGRGWFENPDVCGRLK